MAGSLNSPQMPLKKARPVSDSTDSQFKPITARLARCVFCCSLIFVPAFGQEDGKPGESGQASKTSTPSGNQESNTTGATEGSKGSTQEPAKADPKQKEPEATKPKPAPVTKLVVYDLLKPPIDTTWQLFEAEKGVKLSDVWTVDGEGDERKLVCNGKQKGYLRTREAYENYKLKFEFRFFNENGNSGVLLHVDGKDKIWPDAVQVQLHRPTAGSIIPSGNRKTRFTVGAKLDWAPQKWNTCIIDVRNDTVEVSINGLAVGPLKYCDPCKGFIALQSEGSEVHFRKLTLEREEIVPAKAPSKPPETKKPVTDQPAAEKPTPTPGKAPDA